MTYRKRFYNARDIAGEYRDAGDFDVAAEWDSIAAAMAGAMLTNREPRDCQLFRAANALDLPEAS